MTTAPLTRSCTKFAAALMHRLITTNNEMDARFGLNLSSSLLASLVAVLKVQDACMMPIWRLRLQPVMVMALVCVLWKRSKAHVLLAPDVATMQT